MYEKVTFKTEHYILVDLTMGHSAVKHCASQYLLLPTNVVDALLAKGINIRNNGQHECLCQLIEGEAGLQIVYSIRRKNNANKQSL